MSRDLILSDACAEIWGVKRATWRSYVSRGYAPAPVDRVGREPRWDRAEVEAWAARRPGQGARGDIRREGKGA